MNKRNDILLAAAFLLSLILFGCGGAEDGDLTPPNFTFDGGLPSRTADPGTSTSPYTFFGTTDPDAEIDVVVTFPQTNPVASVTTPVIDASGNWSFDVYELVEGSNIIAIDVSDPAGNSTVYYVTIFLDLTAPVVTLNQFTDYSPTTTQVLAGTVAELDAQDVEVSIDGGLIWNSADDINGGIWTYTVNFPTDATIYDVRVRGTDALGNFPVDPDDALVVQQTIEIDSLNAPAFTAAPVAPLPPGFPAYVETPDVTQSIDLDGTYNSTSYSLVFSTSPATTLTIDTSVADNWSLNVADLLSGITIVNFSIQDSVPAEVAQANVMIVRDLSGPLVIDTVPAHGAQGVTISNIVVTFSETMDFATVTNEMIELTDTAGNQVPFTLTAPTADILDRTFTFTPDTALNPDTRYLLSIVNPVTQSATDVFGNDYVPPSSSLQFTTAP